MLKNKYKIQEQSFRNELLSQKKVQTDSSPQQVSDNKVVP